MSAAEALSLGNLDRPPWIPEAAWSNMSWHARRKATRRLRIADAAADDTPPPKPKRKPRTRRGTPKLRVYRDELGLWVLSDGVQTARVCSAEQAWRLAALVIDVHPIGRGGGRP